MSAGSTTTSSARIHDALWLLRGPQAFAERIARRGDVVRFSLGLTPAYLVSSAEGIHRVSQENFKNYVKGRLYDELRRAYGGELIVGEGAGWRRVRKLAQPFFNAKAMAGHFKAMRSIVERDVAAWPLGRIQLTARLQELGLLVMAATIFGEDLSEADTKGLRDACAYRLEWAYEATRWITMGLPSTAAWPLPSNARLRREIARVDAIVHPIIKKRREQAISRSDLLGALLATVDEEGRPLSDIEVRDEVFGLLLGAHETTASSLSWCVYLLCKHPEIERKLRAEVQRVVGVKRLEFEDLSQLVVLRGAIEEAMRLYPPAWVVFRESREDDVVCGHRIPAGSVVLPCAWVAQRSESYWANPLAFDPSRFAPERRSQITRGAYSPFGVGPHQCIAIHFGLMEMQIILAEILRHFGLRLANERVGIAIKGTLSPTPGVAVDLTRAS